jgi:HD superfamily phosphodiesterase
MLKDYLLKELREYFGVDAKRINHAEKVLGFAEILLEHEPADWAIVVPASILHDIGIKVAEEKYGSAAGHHQEKEGPEIARSILLKTELDIEKIDEICQIIGHHHSPGKINTRNFMVLYDADWLVNLKDEVGIADKDKLKQLISKIFLTRTGKLMAEKLYLQKAA